jgi:TonB family protein
MEIMTYTFIDNDEMPKLISCKNAKYPLQARIKGIEGVVEIELTVSQDGTVSDTKVISSPNKLLSNAAAEAVLEMKFAPPLKENHPISVRCIQKVEFKLSDPNTIGIFETCCRTIIGYAKLPYLDSVQNGQKSPVLDK